MDMAIYVGRERFISKIWLQADKLEIQVRVMGQSLVQNQQVRPAGWKFRQNFYVTVWRQHAFFSRKSQVSFFMPSTDWMRPTHTTEGHLLYFKSINYKS